MAPEEGAAEAVGSCVCPFLVEGRTTAALFAGRLPEAGGGEEGVRDGGGLKISVLDHITKLRRR